MSKHWLSRGLLVGLLWTAAAPSWAADPKEKASKTEAKDKAKKGDKGGSRAQRLKKQAARMEDRAKQLRSEGKADEAARLEARSKKLRQAAASAGRDQPGKSARKAKSPEAQRRERKFGKLKMLKRKYGDKLDDPAVQEELGRHAERAVKLRRMKSLAEAGGKEELVARIAKLKATEDARHQAAMASLLGNPPQEGEAPAAPEEQAQ